MSELYELPEGWKIEKFDDVKISNVIGLVKNVKEQSPTLQYQYVKMNNITNDNRFSFDKIINVAATDEEVKKFNLKKGDFLFNTRNSAELVGKSCIFDYDMENVLYNNNIMRVRFRDDILSYFIAYQFRSKFVKNQLDNIKSATTNVAAIYYKALKEIDILIPPLQEQKRIVAKLDTLFEKIDKAIALHQKNMDEATAFMGSVLNDVFGELAEKYPLQKVLNGLEKILTGTTPPKKEQKYYDNPTINWYSPSDFGKSKILTVSKNMINEISLADKKAKIYDKNTLLLVAIGATVGKIGVIREKASSNQQITALKFKNNIDVDFSYYWFYYIKQTIINTASAATLPIINQSAIKDLKFIIPPLNIQQKTVAYLDSISQKIEKLKQIQKEKMQSLVALKASILDQAFRGKL